jgi:CPA2 family monovalent cation:H+ antiporter-2
MGLFFLSVGMSLDLVKVAGDALWLLLAVPGLYLLKGVVMYGLFRRAGLSSGESAEAALLLGQSGEFAFIVIGIALTGGLLSAGVGNFMLLVATLSMFMTPLAARAGRALHKRLHASDGVPPLPQGLPELGGVVIIAGFGRVGQRVARLLERGDVRWIGIERNVEAAARHHARACRSWSAIQVSPRCCITSAPDRRGQCSSRWMIPQRPAMSCEACGPSFHICH